MSKNDHFKIIVVCFQVAATIFRQVLKQKQNEKLKVALLENALWYKQTLGCRN